MAKPRLRTAPRGFTLLELVMVLVLLAALASMALPRLVELQREARLAKLQTLQVAIITAANQMYALCKVQHTQCNENYGHITPMPGTGLGPRVSAWGILVGMHHGWPSAWDGYGVASGYLSISATVQVAGIYVRPYVGSSLAREFRIPDAPDPANCKVTYYVGFWSAGNTPTYNLSTGGC